MLKQILPLLFTLMFSINLFAESHDIHREISEIKLQIQEIKLLDKLDEREKKIGNIEEDIKKLEEKFNKSDVDKKELDGKIERNKTVVDNLNTFLTVYGILITILLALGSFATYKISSKNALEEAQEELRYWIKLNQDKILEPIKNEGNNLLRNIRKEADVLLQDYQSTMKNHNFKNELDSKEKDILEKVNILLKSKETENYTFNDWYSKSLDYFYKEALDNAIEALDNAIKITTNEIEVATALNNKGVMLGRKGKLKEAIKVYDEVIRRFKDSKENAILEQVIITLLNKIEMNLILNNENLEEDLYFCFNLVKEDKKQLLKFEMLQIFEKAKKSNQDNEIKDWQMKFKDTKLTNDWSFEELKILSETLEDEAKERVLRYIDIFENHNKNIEGK